MEIKKLSKWFSQRIKELEKIQDKVRYILRSRDSKTILKNAKEIISSYESSKIARIFKISVTKFSIVEMVV